MFYSVLPLINDHPKIPGALIKSFIRQTLSKPRDGVSGVERVPLQSGGFCGEQEQAPGRFVDASRCSKLFGFGKMRANFSRWWSGEILLLTD
ncbi:hypothetical protein GWI33_015763 [Rhynchophorus ferrugineus]|uniref:Uncharacterized protein n=1 Tax=Rhynchophorus ferrugineus TaxID=354439 RepID=A0A834M5Q0_RHYFE|nr:hypothetical protein GWI33_015763 [Rhynchophorus ferrugineus]